MRRFLALIVVVLLAACGSGGGGSPLPTQLIKADVDRAPAAAGADLVPAVVDADSQFGLKLLAQLTKGNDENVFISPYSIATALTMAYAGARGDSAAQLAEVLGISELGEGAHAGRNSLDQKLMAPRQAEDNVYGKPLSLDVANSLWGQEGYRLLKPFLEQLARNYAAGMNTVDFEQAAEDARVSINRWVEDKTDGRIKDLLAPGTLDELTRLVLVNTITFDAKWADPFEESDTHDLPFTRADGSKVDVPTMHSDAVGDYVHVAGWKTVRIPYVGQASAVFLLPDDPNTVLDADAWKAVTTAKTDRPAEVWVPKFSYRTAESLAEPLGRMGATLPFVPRKADFSGIDGTHRLWISGVEHQAVVDVDEEGTKAAAATAVVFKDVGAAIGVPQLHLDRPFYFVLQDDRTGEPLFVGRVADPA